MTSVEIIRPLQTTVAPRTPALFKSFARDLLPVFAGMERLSAEPAGDGLLISGIWDADLYTAESLIHANFSGEIVWTKPAVHYGWGPRILEPILRIEVQTPSHTVGNVIGDLMSRRGTLLGQAETPEGLVIAAEVPLQELLGYLRFLPAMTQGKGEAVATFLRYEPAPNRGPDPDEPMSAALRA